MRGDRVIDALEPVRRHVYTGAIGYLDGAAAPTGMRDPHRAGAAAARGALHGGGGIAPTPIRTPSGKRRSRKARAPLDAIAAVQDV